MPVQPAVHPTTSPPTVPASDASVAVSAVLMEILATAVLADTSGMLRIHVRAAFQTAQVVLTTVSVYPATLLTRRRQIMMEVTNAIPPLLLLS